MKSLCGFNTGSVILITHSPPLRRHLSQIHTLLNPPKGKPGSLTRVAGGAALREDQNLILKEENKRKKKMNDKAKLIIAI